MSSEAIYNPIAMRQVVSGLWRDAANPLVARRG